MPSRFLFALAAATALLTLQPAGAQDAAAPAAAPVSIDAAFEAYWAAPSVAEASSRAEAILKTGVTFDDAFARLKRGRTYTAQEPGIVLRTNRGRDGTTYHYDVYVPTNYDPARRYQVRLQLHGALNRETNEPRGAAEEIDPPDREQIYVLPYAWRDAPWWTERQVANLNAIVDTLKRTYNVDENLVVISGHSDGGTSVYYVAMRETTRFASFLPLNGYIMALAWRGIDGRGLDDGAIFPNNLRNKPLFVVNGAKDPVYPIAVVEPFVKHLMKHGVDTAYHPQPNGEHDTLWWPELKDTFEQFVAKHPRDPHPPSVTWETRNLTNNRAHWLVIDRLGSAEGEPASLPDINVVEESNPVPVMVLGPDGAPLVKSSVGPLFRRLVQTSRYGRVDIVRKGNTFEAATNGVTAFTVLLSPDRLDFSKPITVTANGKVVFEGKVERSLPTLMKWAARDNDRTMLYGAEVTVTLPQRSPGGAATSPAN